MFVSTYLQTVWKTVREEKCSDYKTIVSTDFEGLIRPNQLKNSHKLDSASSSSYKEVGVTHTGQGRGKPK